MYLEIKVGRSSGNTIIINDNHISREHAVFKIQDDSIVLEDLKSSNGTFVNGLKITLANVTKSDIIEFSKYHKFDWDLLEGQINKLTDNKPLLEQAASQFKFKIGRDQSNDVVIDNIRISRFHAIVEGNNDNYFIQDLNSLNGVYVNGIKTTRAQITFNDRISVGGFSISLHEIINKRKHSEEGVSLTADSISFSIEDKTIIDDVSFSILPGEFVGLIGESGSGKTTLLTLLNGYLKPKKGGVLLNSIPLAENINEFKGLTGYVPQEDIIYKELTVTESLRYSAELRFDGKLNNNDIQLQVSKIILLLNLLESKDTLIGSSEKKGISGGQRKRVNLGQELISEPSLLFLDEPTSGLDPRSDREVMDLLKALSDKGTTILLTTHNINSENFKIFTHLIVMAKGGKLAYFGRADEVCKYFEVDQPYKIFDKLSSKNSKYWQDKYRNSEIYQNHITNLITKKKDKTPKKFLFQNIKSKFSLSQFLTLLKRNLIIKIRDKISTSILLLQAPIIAILISMVFSRADQEAEALFVLIIASIWLGCSNSAREIVAEQAILKRERKVGLNINSYLLSKYTILSGLCVIQCAILTSITALTLNFAHPLFLFLIVLATSISSLTLGLFVSSYSKTNETAIALIPVILIPQVVLGGLLSAFAKMPALVKVLSSFMLSRWSFEAIVINQFGNGNQVSYIGFNSNNTLMDIAIILSFGIIFFLATALVLKLKDRVG